MKWLLLSHAISLRFILILSFCIYLWHICKFLLINSSVIAQSRIDKSNNENKAEMRMTQMSHGIHSDLMFISCNKVYLTRKRHCLLSDLFHSGFLTKMLHALLACHTCTTISFFLVSSSWMYPVECKLWACHHAVCYSAIKTFWSVLTVSRCMRGWKN
jgi:hypothetical protein